jgi:Reverse transcriptase (RNA-dependent DNA polymerase)
MKQPEGFHQGDPDYVCLLKKSTYGLKQGARQWNKKLHQTLTSMGYKRLESDQSIYIYYKDGVRIIMPIFVDDITLVSNSQESINKTVKELASYFKLRDLGATTYLLGVEIIRNRSLRSIALSQRQYIVDILDRFSHADCKPVSTPMEPGLHLTKDMGATTS